MAKPSLSLVPSLLVLAVCANVFPCHAEDDASRPHIAIAYTSFRDDIRYANVFRYELLPSGEGKLTGKVTPGAKRSDHHPSLSLDGRVAVFAGEAVGTVNKILFWDFEAEQAVPLPSLNINATAQMAPVHNSSKGIIAFEAWNRPGSSGRWDIVLYDLAKKSLVDAPQLNSAKFDERKPALGPEGNWLAYTTNATTRKTLTDIRIYNRQTGDVDTLSQLNSVAMDTEPTLSRDGRLIAFVSDRSGGEGARDIYLYDRMEKQLLPLPGLNSVGQEQSPSLSQDGRFLAFVSERLDAAGERDIFLYDRQLQSLVLTPDLNSPGDEYDPSLIVIENEGG